MASINSLLPIAEAASKHLSDMCLDKINKMVLEEDFLKSVEGMIKEELKLDGHLANAQVGKMFVQKGGRTWPLFLITVDTDGLSILMKLEFQGDTRDL